MIAYLITIGVSGLFAPSAFADEETVGNGTERGKIVSCERSRYVSCFGALCHEVPVRCKSDVLQFAKFHILHEKFMKYTIAGLLSAKVS